MTPNELKDYVDAALRQRDGMQLLWLILVPVISIVGSVLVAYLNEKGKNAATKEDVGRITAEIETAKSHFTERLEHVRAELSSRVHFGKVRYEHELKVFQAVWPKLCDLQTAVRALNPVMDSPPNSGETQESRKLARLGRAKVAYEALDQTVQHSRPFYPDKIWKELSGLLDLCYKEFVQTRDSDSKTDFRNYWETRMANATALNEQVDRTCETIRSRLADFDAA